MLIRCTAKLLKEIGEVCRRVNAKDVRVEAVKRYARMGCPQMGKNLGK